MSGVVWPCNVHSYPIGLSVRASTTLAVLLAIIRLRRTRRLAPEDRNTWLAFVSYTLGPQFRDNAISDRVRSLIGNLKTQTCLVRYHPMRQIC